MLKNLDKRVKKLDAGDIALTKLSVALFVLFVLNIWPSAMTWVANVHWSWFLVLAILFAIRPFKKAWCRG